MAPAVHVSRVHAATRATRPAGLRGRTPGGPIITSPPTRQRGTTLSTGLMGGSGGSLGTTSRISAFLDQAWGVSLDQKTLTETIPQQLFAFSIIPYAGFLYHLTKSKKAPKFTLFGFYFLLVFVFATIPAGIYAKKVRPPPRLPVCFVSQLSGHVHTPRPVRPTSAHPHILGLPDHARQRRLLARECRVHAHPDQPVHRYRPENGPR